MVVLPELIDGHDGIALFGEVQVDVAHTDIQREDGVVVVGVGACACLVGVGRDVAADLGARVERTGITPLCRDIAVVRRVKAECAVVRRRVGIVSDIVALAGLHFVTDIFRQTFRDIGGAHFAEVVAVGSEPAFLGHCRVFRRRDEDIFGSLAGDCRSADDGLVAVALEAELRTDADVKEVAEVEGDVKAALQLFVDKVGEGDIAEGDVFEQVTHEGVAHRNLERAVGDEQLCHSLFELVLAECRFVLTVCGDCLTRGRNFDIVVDAGALNEVVDEVAEHIRNLGHGHRNLGQAEEGEVEIDRLVEIVCAEPLDFRPRFGGEVVQLDCDLRRRQILHVDDERQVKTQMCGGITLAGCGDVDDDAVEVADKAAEHLAEVDFALGDGELELNRHTHRDHGVVERSERHIVVVDFLAAVKAFRGGVDEGVDAVFVGVRLAEHLVIRDGVLALAFEDVVGHERFLGAELEVEAADCEAEVD